METGENIQTSTAPAARKRSRILLVFAALFLGLLLLSAWFTPKALAQDAVNAFDLAISKSSIPEYFSSNPTAQNYYVISVSRTNEDTVGAPVIVEDRLPDELTIITNTISANNWNCQTDDNQRILNCVYGQTIPPDLMTFAPIIFGVNVQSGISITDTYIERIVTNTARLLISDANATNNISSISTYIDPADLQITKVHSPTLVDINSRIIYTITVTNNGPATATNVWITDTYSSLLAEVHAIPDFDSEDSSTTNPIGIWKIPSLPPGPEAQKTFIITATLKTDAEARTIINTAEVKSLDQPDWDLTNNKASTSFTVGDIKITKSILENKEEVYVGEPVTFIIEVSNNTAQPFTGVVVSDVINNVLDVLEYKADLGTISYDANTGKLTNWINTLPANTTKTITVVARPDPTVSFPTEITNTASVSWGNPQITKISNVVGFLAVPAAAIEITKDDGRVNILSGDILTYTITVKNIGSLILPDEVDITDTLPANTTFLNIIEGDFDGDIQLITDSVVTATLDSPLYGAQEASFQIVAKVDNNLLTDTIVTNTVEARAPAGSTVKGLDYDIYHDVNTIKSAASSGMDIDLAVTPTKGKIGTLFTFNITVKNTGSTAAYNTRVTGIMNSILDYSSSTPATGTTFTPLASGTNRSYTWTIGTLWANQSRTLSMVWKVNTTATAKETYEHFATLNWDSTKYLDSNEVEYRIVSSSAVLPETGLYQQQKDSSGLANLALIAGAVLGILGLSALIYGLWARRNKPLWANWFLVTGLILLGGGALFGAAAWGFNANPVEPVQELAAVDRNTPAPEQAVLVQPQATDFVEAFGAWPTPTPLTLPDYPIPTPPASQDDGPLGNEPDPSAVTRIIIPKMGLDTVVKYVPYSNSTWLIGGLRQEIAWMGDTSWPGLGGNTGLAGHVDLANGDSGPFWNLAELAPGDHITLHTEKYNYTYTARETRVVPDTDLSVIQPTDNPQLTLITCIHWDPEFQMYLDRLVVFADLTKVEPLSQVSMSN